MENLLKLLTKEITGVEDPEIAAEDREGTTVYIISAPKEQVGKLIGREGRIISAVRTIASVRAARENTRINIEIKEVTE